MSDAVGSNYSAGSRVRCIAAEAEESPLRMVT